MKKKAASAFPSRLNRGLGASGGAVDPHGGHESEQYQRGLSPLDPISISRFEGEHNTEALSSLTKQEQGNSKLVARKIREEFIREQMRQRKEEYTDTRSLNVFVGTWNVNGKKPLEDITPWLSVGGETSQPPDVYAIGFQEIVDLTASNVVLDSGSKDRSNVWLETIALALQRKYPQKRYHLVSERHLVGVMMCVFVLSDHVQKMPKYSIQTTLSATGVMGMGNKGAVLIRMQLYDSTFCFICGHLAAHREHVEARNADYRNIMLKSTFSDELAAFRHTEERLAAPLDGTLLLPDGRKAYHSSIKRSFTSEPLRLEAAATNLTFGPLDHDYVFWLGDFNYRIHADHSVETVYKHVFANDLAWLRANDQLLLEQAAGRTFVGFKEAQIQFLPTYKFQTGTNNYDRRPEKKQRAPAYCDRVLWRDVNNSHARVLKYMSCPTMCSSDHKPVMAMFDVRVRERSVSRRSQVFQDIVRHLDTLENNDRPQVSIDRSTVTFPEGLAYMERREEPVVLTNVGQVPVTWRFVPKMEDLAVSKRWLCMSPNFGILVPGASVTITISGLVDAKTAGQVLTKAESLEDVLVLRLENGRDHFVCVSATLLPTCFGASLGQLVRSHAPFAADESEREAVRLDRISRLGEAQASQPLKIPKELWWLCNFLWNYDLLKVPGIFAHSTSLATAAKMAMVRRCLDAGHDLVPDDNDQGVAMAHAVAAVLIEFLDGLPDPVVPFVLFPRADIDSASAENWLRRFLEQLPPLENNVFLYMVTFAREVAKNMSYNHVDPRELSGIFAHCLFRPVEALERQQLYASGTSMQFPNWLGGEKKSGALGEVAQRILGTLLSSTIS
mmetsp:Transcript_13038/g.23138  ORF Transcript_13038/g.23138 Transcript_13038/m.23138 type:complete len:841 (+) Transcript_13038:63-2585(+)